MPTKSSSTSKKSSMRRICMIPLYIAIAIGLFYPFDDYSSESHPNYQRYNKEIVDIFPEKNHFVTIDLSREFGNGELQNLKVHYTMHGNKNGPLVLLSHGISTTTMVMQRLEQAIGDAGYLAISFDFFGRGHSDAPVTVQYTEKFLEKQVFKFLDALLAEKVISEKQHNGFHYIGYSMGGAVATEFGAQHPDRLKSLILIAAAGMDCLPMPATAKLLMIPGVNWITTNTNIGRILLDDRIVKAFERPEENEDIILKLKMLSFYHLHKPGFNEAFTSSVQHFPLNNMTHSFVKVGKDTSFPVQLIWGTADHTVPIECAHQAKEIIPRAELKIVPNTGHMIVSEEFEPTKEAIITFLNKVK